MLVVSAGAVSLIVAIGPTFLGLPAPFRLLYDFVPGFNGMKAVSRLAVVLAWHEVQFSAACASCWKRACGIHTVVSFAAAIFGASLLGADP